MGPPHPQPLITGQSLINLVALGRQEVRDFGRQLLIVFNEEYAPKGLHQVVLD
jgi:hypothetical protein